MQYGTVFSGRGIGFSSSGWLLYKFHKIIRIDTYSQALLPWLALSYFAFWQIPSGGMNVEGYLLTK
jgi:hypothetical protein